MMVGTEVAVASSGGTVDVQKPSCEWRKENMQLLLQPEHILGLTVTLNACFAVCSSTGLLAYTAGCAIVLYQPVTNNQRHLMLPNKQVPTAISIWGKYVASGEKDGQVRVFDTETGSQLCELSSGHSTAVSSIAFSADGNYLVSLDHHLMIVWQWQAGQLVTTHKLLTQIKAVSFACDGSYFVTVGLRHVKFWYMTPEVPVPTLTGRSAVLGELKDETFCDVACGTNSQYVYTITKSGFVCQFNNQRLLQCLTSIPGGAEAYCLCVSLHSVIVGCSNGQVLIYDPLQLNLAGSLPLPDQHVKKTVHPDCIAMRVDDASNRIAVIYSDHSLHVWDTANPADIRLVTSQSYHSQCIYGLEIYAPSSLRQSPLLPLGSFITSSADSTVRIWSHSDFTCLRIIHTDSNNNKVSNEDGGIHCVKVDVYGEQMAFGDASGFVHVYDLTQMRETLKIEAHASAVLCLVYSAEYLVSGGKDGVIQVFAVDDEYSCVQTLEQHRSSVTALRFSQGRLISCGLDQQVVLWTVSLTQSREEPMVFQERGTVKGGGVCDMVVDGKTQCVITANQDGQLRRFSLKTSASGKPEKMTAGCMLNEGSLVKMDYLQEEGFAVVSCADKSLCIVDVESGERWANLFAGHSEIVNDLRFCDDGKRLITVSGDSCFFIWKMKADLLFNNGSHRHLETLPSLRPTLSTSSSNSNGYVSDISTMNEPAEYGAVQPRPLKLNLGAAGLPSWARKDAGKKRSPLHEVAPALPAGRWAQDLDIKNHLSPPTTTSKRLGSSSRSSSRPASPATAVSDKVFDDSLSSTQSTDVPQTSIFAFLGKPRRTNSNELDDAEDEVLKGNVLEHIEVDSSESVSTVSTGTVSPSPPPSSRPETPLGAASRFLHINEKGIDKVIKRRLPLRSVTMNKVRTVEAAPAMEGPAEQADQAKNTPAQVSPSRRLIQNAKLAANRRQFQSTQNLASEESASLISTDLEAANRPTTTAIAPRGYGPVHNMRRAASMMNINSVGLSKETSEFEGFGSLLERAKARLSAIKQNSNDSAASSRLHSESQVKPEQSWAEAEQKAKLRLARSLAPPRSRSGDRGISVPRSVSQSRPPSGESPAVASNSSVKVSPGRRLRLNSASSRAAAPVNNGSPTAQAIARIKAGLGLLPPSKSDSGKGGVEVAAVVRSSLRYADCVEECRVLANALEAVMRRLGKLESGEDSADRKQEQIALCTETLSKTTSQLGKFQSTSSSSDVLRNSPNYSKHDTNGSASSTINSATKILFTESPVQMII